MVISAVSTDVSLEVLVTPDDNYESVLERISPASKRSGAGVPDSSATPPLTDWIGKSFRLFSLHSGWQVKDSMILFKRNFDKFFPAYYRDVRSWLGYSTTIPGLRESLKFSKFMFTLFRTRGINQVILTLKIYLIVCLNYLAGTPKSSTQDLGQRVRLIKGLPAHLPVLWRRQIRDTNLPAINTILTLLNSYKGFQGTYKQPDLSSITTDSPMWAGYDEDLDDMYAGLPTRRFIQGHAPGFWKQFNKKGVIPEIYSDSFGEFKFSFSAGTNHKMATFSAPWDAYFIKQDRLMYGLFQHYANTVMALYKSQTEGVPPEDQPLYKKFKFIGIPFNGVHPIISFIDTIGSEIGAFVESTGLYDALQSYAPSLIKRSDWVDGKPTRPVGYFGKLALKWEAAGKVRVFAMVDYWTHLILRPFHRVLFKILRAHPCDATFDQLGKVKEFQQRNYRYFASIDLKSATDLIPIELYISCFSSFTSPSHAKAWAYLLTERKYYLPTKLTTGEFTGIPFKYGRGQPMGALSSWAALAVVHHFLVYLSAVRANIVNFQDYLVLGDDLVIANRDVAREYISLCEELEIPIGAAKSFQSETFFQFASQDCLGQDNISPISLKEVLSVAGYSQYFGKEFNLSKALEFTRRLTGKSFIDETLMSSIRASVTGSRWKEYSRLFSKGIVPLEVMSYLTSLNAKKFLTEKGTSIFDLMASIRGDYRIFTGTHTYSEIEVWQFVRDISGLVTKDITKMLDDLTTFRYELNYRFPSFFYNLEVKAVIHKKQEEFFDQFELLEKREERLEVWLGYWSVCHSWNILMGYTLMEYDYDPLREALLLREDISRFKTDSVLEQSVISSINTKRNYMTRLLHSLRVLQVNNSKKEMV